MPLSALVGSGGPASLGSAAAIFAALVAFAALASIARSYVRLSHVPGPFWCRLSDVQRVRWAWSNRIHERHIALHRRYGDVVRIGPNCVSVGSPLAIPTIYGTGANLPKSDFYKVLQPLSQGRVVQGLFNTQSEALHRALKRPIAGIYSMTNLVSFEPYVDTTINVFLDRLEAEQRAKQAAADAADAAAATGAGSRARASDLGAWLQFFAFDVMGEITFSKRFGFLDRAADVDGIIGDIYRFFSYGHAVGQMPALDRLWAKNPLVHWLLPRKKAANSPVVAFTLARAEERQAARKAAAAHRDSDSDGDGDGGDPYNARDFMSRFIEARAKDPSIPEAFLTAWATSNVQAGSDTTAILLRAIVHFLLTHPASLAKLHAELRCARAEGRLSAGAGRGVVTWKESRSLPYLDACVKEAGRLHSPVGLPMERVVTAAAGLDVCGVHLPAGTVVGLSPWVVHRDRRIFGADADDWNPDRWLAAKDDPRRAAMERSLLTFGAGHRTCLGKNISYLEIYKLIPTLFARYDITLATPDEWKLVNHWLVFQEGLNVTLRIRDGAEEDEERVDV